MLFRSPPSALYAEEFIASSQTDPAPLIEIIEQDPSVSVNVLRRVNSAYYGVRREVESIDQAVRLLGFVKISSIVLIQGVNDSKSISARIRPCSDKLHTRPSSRVDSANGCAARSTCPPTRRDVPSCPGSSALRPG